MSCFQPIFNVGRSRANAEGRTAARQSPVSALDVASLHQGMAARSSNDPPAPAPDAASAVTTASVALAFAGVPFEASARATAEACVAAARSLFGRARLVLPPDPVPLVFGDPDEDLRLLVRFPAAGGDGELWTAPGEAPAEPRALLEMHMLRIWAVQRERSARQGEIDGLRFHLTALQQVTHTLSEVRKIEEIERIALDFVREICFSWWTALYRSDEQGAFLFRASVSTRGDEFAGLIPYDGVQPILQTAHGRSVVIDAEQAHAAGLPRDTAVLAPVHLGEAGSGVMVLGPRVTGTPYTEQDLALVQALVDASAIAMRNADLIQQLRTQAIRDALTGCQNRRGFDEILAVEFSRSRRYERTLSIVLLDLDHFKAINDDLGHEAGDHVLRRIGRLLLTSFRATDTACRYGGEEFALIFPETSKQDAARLAERLRTSIEAMPCDNVMQRPVTASFGVAAYPDDAECMDGLVRAADRALYRAKSGGRNRVVATEDGGDAASLVQSTV